MFCSYVESDGLEIPWSYETWQNSPTQISMSIRNPDYKHYMGALSGSEPESKMHQRWFLIWIWTFLFLGDAHKIFTASNVHATNKAEFPIRETCINSRFTYLIYTHISTPGSLKNTYEHLMEWITCFRKRLHPSHEPVNSQPYQNDRRLFKCCVSTKVRRLGSAYEL